MRYFPHPPFAPFFTASASICSLVLFTPFPLLAPGRKVDSLIGKKVVDPFVMGEGVGGDTMVSKEEFEGGGRGEGTTDELGAR